MSYRLTGSRRECVIDVILPAWNSLTLSSTKKRKPLKKIIEEIRWQECGFIWKGKRLNECLKVKWSVVQSRFWSYHFFFSSFKPSVWGNFCIKLMGMKLWVKKAIYLFSQEGFLASNGAKGVKGRGHIDFFSCCCCCFFSFNVNPF